MIVRLVILLFLSGLLLSGCKEDSNKDIKLYWMPYCPYGQEAVRLLLDAAKTPAEFKAIDLRYIANEHSSEAKLTTGAVELLGGQSEGCSQAVVPGKPDFHNFSSLHGTSETEESIRQLLIQNYWPDKFKSYLELFLKNPRGKWTDRAKESEISETKLSTLLGSEEADVLFSKHLQIGRKHKISVSPTLVSDGRRLPEFPKSAEKLRNVLCVAGILLERSCIGILCTEAVPCPEEFGYQVRCVSGKCVSKIAPLEADAVGGYLIVPNECIPCEMYSLEQGLGGWNSRIIVQSIDSSTAEAQAILEEIQFSSFPVLVVSAKLSDREWGERCVSELGLTRMGSWYGLPQDTSPFPGYSTVKKGSKGFEVSLNHFLGALQLHRRGAIQKACKSYRLALRDNPKDYRAWNNLGSILYDSLDMKEAGGEMFERALSFHNRYQPALRNRIRYLTDTDRAHQAIPHQEKLAWDLALRGKYEEAGMLFQDVVSSPVYAFSAYKGLGYIMAKTNQPDKALEYLIACLTQDQRPDADFYNLLAGVYYRLGDLKRARQWYENAIDEPRPMVQSYKNLCVLLKNEAKWSDLMDYSTRGQKLAPTDFAFLSYEVDALEGLGRLGEAVILMEKLGEGHPEAGLQVKYRLASLYLRLSRPSQAANYAGEFFELFSRSPKSSSLAQAKELSLILLDHAAATEVERAFLLILRVKPADIDTHLQLADWYQRQGREEKGAEHFKIARQFGAEINETR